MPNTVLYALTVLIWGSTWFAVSFQIGHVHPFLSVCYRFSIAAITLFIFLAATGRLRKMVFPLRQHMYLALQGLFLFCLNFWLFYQGTSYLTTGLVSVIFSSMSLLNTLNQALFFRIPFNRKVIVGSFFGLTGIALVFWHEIDSLNLRDGKIIGIFLCLAGSYSASLGNMVSLRNTRNGIPVIEGNAMGMVYGAAYAFILALLSGATLSFEFTAPYIVSLLYLSIFGSAVAFGCYLTLVHRIGADKAAYATILFPVVALTISTFFEGYVWTPTALAGIALILFGNVITLANRENLLQWRPRRAREIIRTESAAESPGSEPTADSPK